MRVYRNVLGVPHPAAGYRCPPPTCRPVHSDCGTHSSQPAAPSPQVSVPSPPSLMLRPRREDHSQTCPALPAEPGLPTRLGPLSAENTASSASSGAGQKKNPFDALHYPKHRTKVRVLSDQTRCFFSAKPLLWGFHFTLFSTAKTPNSSLLLPLTETSSQRTLFGCLRLEATSRSYLFR